MLARREKPPLQDVQKEKKRLREDFVQQREALPFESRTHAGSEIARRLSQLKELSGVREIGLYWAFRGELPTDECFRRLREEKVKVYLPRISVGAARFEFAPLEAETQLVTGPFGISQPDPELPGVDPAKIPILLIPGVVFDGRGHRIGWGKGFYDRLLKGYLGKRIALAYDFQVLERIPFDFADEAVDLIVTERRVVKCSGRQ